MFDFYKQCNIPLQTLYRGQLKCCTSLKNDHKFLFGSQNCSAKKDLVNSTKY